MSYKQLSVLLTVMICAACNFDILHTLPFENEHTPQVQGRIEYKNGRIQADSRPVEAGEIITSGTKITSAAQSSADLVFSTASMRMGSSTSLKIKKWNHSPDNSHLEIDLGHGLLICKGFYDGTSRFFIFSPSAVISGTDAQFSVITDAYGTTKINVQSGEIALSSRIEALDQEPAILIDEGHIVKSGSYVIMTPKRRQIAESAYAEALKTEKLPSAALDSIRTALIIPPQARGVLDFAQYNLDVMTIDIAGIDEVQKKAYDYSRNGLLTIASTQVYHSYGGKIIWKSVIKAGPLRNGAYTYIAGEDRIYCANSRGYVVWFKTISYISDISLNAGILNARTAYGNVLISIPRGRVIEVQ